MQNAHLQKRLASAERVAREVVVMRILHVTQHGSVIGGVETYAADLHRLLRREGYAVTLIHGIAPSGSPIRTIAPESLLVPALRPEAGKWSEREIELRRVVEQIAPDVILTHDVEEAEVLRLFSHLRPTIPFVHVQSRYVCPGRGKFYARQKRACERPFGAYCAIAPYWHACGTRRPWRLLTNLRVTKRWIETARQLKRLLVASEYMKRELLAVGFSEDQIVVNPPFVEPFSTEEESPLVKEARQETLPIVLFCGRFYDYKGADLLLRALEFVGPPVHAVLIGEGPEQPKLKRLASRIAARHIVSFLGWLSRAAVFGFYRRARVVVIPSIWPEPFGRVGPEAMRQGAPIVAFRVGAIPEWVRDGETGWLVEPGDVRALATAIERMVSDEALAAAMSARAMHVAAEQFDARRHVERLRRVFEEARQEAR